MSGFIQYLKDTQGELRHVAWPTRLQTIVYTVLVALVSIGVALYLGLFDFIFTTGMKQVLTDIPSANPIQITQQVATGSPVQIDATPVFEISTSTQ